MDKTSSAEDHLESIVITSGHNSVSGELKTSDHMVVMAFQHLQHRGFVFVDLGLCFMFVMENIIFLRFELVNSTSVDVDSFVYIES